MNLLQPWTCLRCGEQMEAHCAMCGNCGAGRDGSLPPSPDHTEVFEVLNRSEEMKALLQYAPANMRQVVRNMFWILLGLSLIMLAMFGSSDSAASTGLILLGVCPLLVGLYDLLKFTSSSLERLPAIVAYKSKKVYAGHEHGAAGGAVLFVCCV